MADELTAGEAIIEGDIQVRIRGRLRRVYAHDGRWFAKVALETEVVGCTQVTSVPLRDVVMIPKDDPPQP